jgi:hypothetical protein
MSKASKILLCTVVLCGLPFAGPARQREGTTKADVVLLKGKPTVYITFERAGERKPVYAKESNRGIWLRLYNNTRWSISFCTESLYIGTKTTPLRLSDGRGVLGLRDGVEISPCYEVEAVRGYESERTRDGGLVIEKPIQVSTPPVGTRGDVSSISWLPSGRSAIFSIPGEHLAKHLAIYVVFNYEWETGVRDVGNGEPQHRVYFRASDLPENVQQK